MNGLPAGLYQPGDSVIHRMDASTKILCLLFLLLAVVNTDSPAGFAAWAPAVALLVRSSRISPRTALRNLMRINVPFYWEPVV